MAPGLEFFVSAHHVSSQFEVHAMLSQYRVFATRDAPAPLVLLNE
jgi:hypothetical protein